MSASQENLSFLKKTLAAQISRFARYYDALIQYMPLDHDSGGILAAIDCPSKSRGTENQIFGAGRVAVLLNGSLNYSQDVQGVLQGLLPSLSRSSRVIAVLYNPYLKLLYELSNAIGVRQAPVL